jgi:hypothetical protein
MLMSKMVLRLRDNRGAAMIEAAFILPIFFLLIFTALEFGMIIFYSFVLESAMFDASRLAKVSDNSQQTVAAIRQSIQDRSFGLIPANDVLITTNLQANLAENWQNDPAEQCTDANNVILPGEFCPCSVAWSDANGNNLCDIGPPPIVLEAPGNFVEFVAFYKKPLYSPIVSFIANLTGNRRVLSAAVVVRNEP